MTRLNPCPNCGSEPHIAFYEDVTDVFCKKCGDNTAVASRSASGAINAWNAATSDSTTQSGKTLRDEFAMAALMGMLAYPGCQSYGSYHNNSSPASNARMAYEYADAMLKERNK